MDLAAARYTDLPFPRYAYRPGANPHPVADPQGHSYRPPGCAAPIARPVSPQEWRRSDDYLYGCDLYNHAYWWEAHEAWEVIWHASGKGGPQARFLQGLIQASACALKVQGDNRRGARRLLERSRAHLAAVRAHAAGRRFMGLDLDGWPAAVSSYYGRLLAGAARPLRHDPKRYPYIVLEDGS